MEMRETAQGIHNGWKRRQFKDRGWDGRADVAEGRSVVHIDPKGDCGLMSRIAEIAMADGVRLGLSPPKGRAAKIVMDPLGDCDVFGALRSERRVGALAGQTVKRGKR